ncbi:hypothetical protein Tco_0359747 [Tanacetum coccineum]
MMYLEVSFDISPQGPLKLTCRIRDLEDKLKGRKRKFVMTESNIEEEEEKDVDPLIKLAKAAATAADDSAVPTGGSNEDDIPPSSFIPSDDPSDKGKSPMLEEEPLVRERSFRKREEDRLGAEAARRLYEEEQMSCAREKRELKQKRQKDVLGVCKIFHDVIGRVKWVSSTIFTLAGTMKHVRSFSDDQLKDEFDKIRHAVANLHTQYLRRSLKRQGADIEQPDSKKSKSTEHQKTSVPAASRPSSAGHLLLYTPIGFSATPTVTRTSGPRTRNQSSAAGIKTYSTRRKSLGSRKMSSSEVDLNAADTFFIKVLCDDDSDDSDGDTNPHYWHAFAAWEIVPTGLGDVNALYFTDKSSNCAGMMLWGDLHVLFESVEGGSSVEVWADQKDWVVRSWRLFPFSGVHVLETFSGTVLYMFADTPYPLSASTMKKMLKHKLEVEITGIGNDMTHAEQLIAFIKNRLAACLPSA